MKNFKILIAGNMVNQGFVTASKLRERGVNVELLMEKNPKTTADPAYLDSNLKDNYPDWINFFDKKNQNWKFDIIRLMKKFDLIHAWVEFSIFASFSGKPFIANTQGSDFRELSISKSLRGILLRRAYKKSKIIIYNQPDFWNINEKILNEKGIFVPIIWDKENWPRYERIDNSNVLKIFHPTNLDFHIKKNQPLLEGFGKFIEKYPNSRLLIVDRGVDAKKVHDLVKKLKIEKYVDFVEGPLDKMKMAEYYNNSDIIADQFGVGSMGSIALESMIYEKSLITYIDKNAHKKSYGSIPPIISAKSSEEIFDGLMELKDKSKRKAMGKELNLWFKTYHSAEKISERISTIYNLIEKGSDTNSIRNELLKKD